MSVSRSLTENEIKLARTLFGAAIDYARVRVHDRPYVPVQPKRSGMSPRGEIYAHGCYSADYAKETVPNRAFFLHEMVHVWQYQNKILHPISEAAKLQLQHKFNYDAAYYFSLDPKKDLTSYGMEQQAAIVEEYYLLQNGLQTGRCTDKIDVAEKQERLKKVLENFLKNPAYAARKSFLSPRRRFGR